MTDHKLPAAAEPVKRPASQLTSGDRIAAGFLPGDVRGHRGALVVFVYPYTLRIRPAVEEEWVFAVWVYPDGVPDSGQFLADALIPVVDTGLGFTDLADRIRTPDGPVPAETAGWANGDRGGELSEVHPPEQDPESGA